jgi:hypothetical protein
MANRHGRLHPGTIAAIVLAVAAIVFIAGSYLISDNMNKTADAVGSSSGQSHQPRPNNLQSQPARDARGTTGSSGIQGTQDTNVPPAGSQR